MFNTGKHHYFQSKAFNHAFNDSQSLPQFSPWCGTSYIDVYFQNFAFRWHTWKHAGGLICYLRKHKTNRCCQPTLQVCTFSLANHRSLASSILEKKNKKQNADLSKLLRFLLVLAVVCGSIFTRTENWNQFQIVQSITIISLQVHLVL